MFAIETENLTKRYKEKIAVNSINLQINQGALFALLGTNAAGKTTTIKMLSTLILPTHGKIKINGLDIVKDRQKIKEILNVSPQETAIAPNLSVMENLQLICGIHGFSKEKTKEIVRRAGNMEITFHRAFDICSNPMQALEDVIECGCTRILTSGWKNTAFEGMSLLKDLVQQASGRIKIMAGMNITETRLPQDGAIKGQFGDVYLDMRVSCLPVSEGEKIVIRILDYTRSLQGIDSLGFNEFNLKKIKR